MLVVMLALACFLNYFAVMFARQEGGVLGVAIAAIVGCITLVGPITAVVLMRRARRGGEMSIDPVRGEIWIGRSYEIPFSKVRHVEVVEHEYTYTAMGPELDTSSSDITGWAIDIGGGVRLCGENGLSRERIVEIADALKVRVEAYQARTGQGPDPLPRPGQQLLERMAGALREEGETFREDWLTLDGPMAEWMREYHNEPDERTMGRNGEFAKALRKAGFDVGGEPGAASPSAGETR